MSFDLEPDFQIQAIARWLIETPKAERPRPAVVEIRKIRAGGADASA
ncbi:hypothetical protein [Mesorhizobium sp. LjNodule214]